MNTTPVSLVAVPICHVMTPAFVNICCYSKIGKSHAIYCTLLELLLGVMTCVMLVDYMLVRTDVPVPAVVPLR